MQTWTAIQIPTSRLQWQTAVNENNETFSQMTQEEWTINLKLMLFWSANWMPLTISGISGTMARTVTPIKYWRIKCECKHYFRNKRRSSCQGNVWLCAGVIWPGRCWAGPTRAGCSPWPGRHKQTSVRWPWWGWWEISTWTSGPRLHGGGPPLQAQSTESPCSLTGKLRNSLVTLQCRVCLVSARFALNTRLVLRWHECRRYGSVSSRWMSSRWCKRLAGGPTQCTPAAWQEQRPSSREGGKTSNWCNT